MSDFKVERERGDGVERSCVRAGGDRVVKPCRLEKGVRDEGLKSEISEALMSEFSGQIRPNPAKKLAKTASN